MEWVCSGCKPPNKRTCAILIARQARGARLWLADPGESARDVGRHLIQRHHRSVPRHRARDRLARAHARVRAHLSPHERRSAAPRAPHRHAHAPHLVSQPQSESERRGDEGRGRSP